MQQCRTCWAPAALESVLKHFERPCARGQWRLLHFAMRAQQGQLAQHQSAAGGHRGVYGAMQLMGART